MKTPIPVGAESAYRLNELSNDDLLASTRQLVGASNQVLAALLAHLGEVEARGVHRDRACATLYTYCIYELRFSEDAAFRRSKAARIVRDFPKLLGAVARGELHLTGLLMLGPHLTDENVDEVLDLAKHRTKREISALVRKIDPLPDVPSRIEPLGPAVPRTSTANPSWATFVSAFAGPVRQLSEGDRPADWVPSELPMESAMESANEPTPQPTSQAEPQAKPSPLTAPQRYNVQFTASQQYVDLLQEARDLLSHASPDASLDDVHVRALELLVAELRKKKYAETDRPRERKSVDENCRELGEPRRSGRNIPAAVRRAVAKRDGGRCTYVDPQSGQRCRETRLLEFHHEDAHALGGPATTKNLTLRCHAHNALAAERDFGRDVMLEKIADSPRRRG